MIGSRVESDTTQSKEYPKFEPAATLAAQLPGSIKPTVTRKLGPI